VVVAALLFLAVEVDRSATTNAFDGALTGATALSVAELKGHTAVAELG